MGRLGSEIEVRTHAPLLAANENAREERDVWSLALVRMTDALDLLDQSCAPPEVGADLDLAIQRLRSAIESPHHQAG